MSKEIIFTIGNGNVEIQLGEGWPPDAEATNEAKSFMKGIGDVTIKQHRPHMHHKEANKNTITA